jgi:Mor family transcriptional regulator
MSDDIYSQIQQEIVESAAFLGIGIGVSADLSKSVVERLQKMLGKTTVYFPEKNSNARDAKIRLEFNGANRDELMKKYGISSKATFYKAIKTR